MSWFDAGMLGINDPSDYRHQNFYCSLHVCICLRMYCRVGAKKTVVFVPRQVAAATKLFGCE